jgi:hypothetical protein
MLDLKSHRPETFGSDPAGALPWPRITELERSFDAGRRGSATVHARERRPYARAGVALSPALSDSGRQGGIASSLVRASVGFLVSVALLVVIMTGLAALS